MKDTTIIKLARLGCGTALLITKAVTGIDGTLIAVAFFLLGVPFELVKKEKEETTKAKA